MLMDRCPLRLLLILPVLALGINAQEIRRPLSRPVTDPLVSALLKSEADGDLKHESTFFRNLHRLARRQRIQPDELTNYDSGEGAKSGRARAILTKGRAVTLVSGGVEYVIVVLGTNPFSVPGVEAQKLLLVDRGGKVIDQLSCGINSRYGTLVTEFTQQPQDDRAQLAIRFVSSNQSVWHNWHTINYERESYTFWVLGNHDPVDLTKSGLVRLAVGDGKFKVVIPELTEKRNSEKPMAEHIGQLKQTYVSPDGAIRVTMTKVNGCDESRIEIRKTRGAFLLRKSFLSSDCEHGMQAAHAAWTSDSKNFVFNVHSTGGHQPLLWPIYFWNRRDNKLRNLDRYVGPIGGPDFNMNRQVVTMRVLTTDGGSKPLRVNLDRIRKRARNPRSITNK